MKGLSVVVTMLLFVISVALSNHLKKTGAMRQESGAVSADIGANYTVPGSSGNGRLRP
jgi:hypothetical protein